MEPSYVHIKDEMVALQIREAVFACILVLQSSLKKVQGENCSIEERVAYTNFVNQMISEFFTRALTPLYQRHPSLEVPFVVNKEGKYDYRQSNPAEEQKKTSLSVNRLVGAQITEEMLIITNISNHSAFRILKTIRKGDAEDYQQKIGQIISIAMLDILQDLWREQPELIPPEFK
jgi:hypothetical protein